LFRSTNARAVDREKAWQASSFSAKCASVSTIFPAHFPQVSSALQAFCFEAKKIKKEAGT
jgi:hypothetical protein